MSLYRYVRDRDELLDAACVPACGYPATVGSVVNPPPRSLRWVEAMLSGLAGEGFSDGQVLFTYRTFDGFLLGYLPWRPAP